MILFDYHNFPFRYSKPYTYMNVMCGKYKTILDESKQPFSCFAPINGVFHISSHSTASYQMFDDDKEVYGI